MKKLILALIFGVVVFGGITGVILAEKNIAEGSFNLFGDSITFNVFTSIEKTLLDLRFYFREPTFKSDTMDSHVEESPLINNNAVIVGIDQESLLDIGEWPWYRYVYEDFLRKIQTFSPLSIHMDIIFNIPQKAPSFLQARIEKSKNEANINVQDYYTEMDDLFINELQKYDNVYLDQFLMKSKIYRFDTGFIKRLAKNEQVLKGYAIPYQGNLQNLYTPYVFTEPLMTGVLNNAIPAVVNAEADNDQVLRNATLLYPYLTQDHEKILLSSIYMFLFLNYYQATKDQVIATDNEVVIQNALVPSLDPITKKPFVEEVELEKLLPHITKSTLQKKYNDNLFNYIVGIYESRFQADTLKVPEFPIQIKDNGDGSFTIISGLEVLDAAKRLNSKFIKVIVKRPKDVVIPVFANEDNNPFNFFINYSSRQIVQGYNALTKQNYAKFMLPRKSFKDVYFKPTLPQMPNFSEDENVLAKAIRNNQAVQQWFQNYIHQQVKLLEISVYDKYQNIDPYNMLAYSVNENHFEGFFYLVYLYFQEYRNLNTQMSYQNFVKDLFQKNNVDGNHPLLTDFIFNERVIYDTLLDAYGEGYKTYYNKTVFVGSLTTGMAQDVHKTTYGDMFGINTIFNAFSTVTNENQLDKFTLNQELFVLFLFCLVVALIYMYSPIFFKYFFIAASTIGILIVSYVLFVEGYIVTTFPFMVANLLIFGIIILYAVLLEEKDKRFIQEAFGDYLSPELIDEMSEKKQRPQLGGEEKNITAYFTDIQGFSSFSELLTATQLVELLNEYLGKMTDILLHEKGTLDKYEGDAIIAFFGAPAHLGDNALRACRTALIMQKALEELKVKWRQETSTENRNVKNFPEERWVSGSKWPTLVHNMRMRIGINTGDIVVGNMGSEKRKNYTMMGDSVNLAARLESLSKQYSIFTMVSEFTLQTVNEADPGERITGDYLLYRKLDRVNVVGKEEPINIYELLALKDDESAEIEKLSELKTHYEKGLELYFNQDWKAAITAFKASLEVEKESEKNPSTILIERCEAYKKNPPVASGKKWDGVFKATNK